MMRNGDGQQLVVSLVSDTLPTTDRARTYTLSSSLLLSSHKAVRSKAAQLGRTGLA